MAIAVIKTGGKQYIVEPGVKLKIEQLPQEEGTVTFEEVLLVSDDASTTVGEPTVPGAVVTAKIMGSGRSRKITNLRFHSKTRHRRKKGHRQCYTEVEITNIA